MLQKVELFKECNKKYDQYGYVFQQDGATFHTTPGSIDFIAQKHTFFWDGPQILLIYHQLRICSVS